MGGHPPDKASKEAAAAEAARQAAISQSQAAINGVFNSPQRASDIADYVNATRNYYQQDLDQQKALNDRQLKFSLARGGLVGGSEQVDKQAQLGKDYTRGVLAVDQKARGAGAGLEAQDQDARARLIALATSGLDATTAASQSAAALRTSLESAQAGSTANALGNQFADFDQFFSATKDADARRRANQAAGLSDYAPIYGTPGFPGYGGH